MVESKTQLLTQKILFGGSLLAYIIGSGIQIFYLIKYNSLTFFSLSQSVSDGLICLIYFFIYVLLPCSTILTLLGEYDNRIKKGGKEILVLMIIGIIAFFLPVISWALSLQDPLLANFSGRKTTLSTMLPLILNIFSLYTYGLIAKQKTPPLSFHSENKYKDFAKTLFYSSFALIYAFILIILSFSVSFNLSAENLFINLPTFIALNLLRATIIYSTVTKGKDNQSGHDDKSYTEGKNNSMLELSYLILFLCLFILPFLYLYRLSNFVIQQYTNTSMVYIDQTTYYNVLYKNDKYIIAGNGDDQSEVIIIPDNNSLIFKVKQSSEKSTIDNFLINIKDTKDRFLGKTFIGYRYIGSLLNKISHILLEAKTMISKHICQKIIKREKN